MASGTMPVMTQTQRVASSEYSNARSVSPAPVRTAAELSNLSGALITGLRVGTQATYVGDKESCAVVSGSIPWTRHLEAAPVFGNCIAPFVQPCENIERELELGNGALLEIAADRICVAGAFVEWIGRTREVLNASGRDCVIAYVISNPVRNGNRGVGCSVLVPVDKVSFQDRVATLEARISQLEARTYTYCDPYDVYLDHCQKSRVKFRPDVMNVLTTQGSNIRIETLGGSEQLGELVAIGQTLKQLETNNQCFVNRIECLFDGPRSWAVGFDSSIAMVLADLMEKVKLTTLVCGRFDCCDSEDTSKIFEVLARGIRKSKTNTRVIVVTSYRGLSEMQESTKQPLVVAAEEKGVEVMFEPRSSGGPGEHEDPPNAQRYGNLVDM